MSTAIAARAIEAKSSHISKQVTIGKTVKFFGTVVSGTAITMKSGSTLNGRALAHTAGVQLDANSVKIPTACTHVQ
jgi:hypothetical protein